MEAKRKAAGDDFSIEFHENNRIWKLKEWIPKVKKMQKGRPKKVYSFDFQDPLQFFNELERKKIGQVGLVVSASDLKVFQFPYGEKLKEFEKMPFLSLENRLVLKNKILYIYRRTQLEDQSEIGK